MPLDHYVSQVHLKRFYSPMLGNRMYAIRKSDLKCFMPNAKSVCRTYERSTNIYLRENRAIEEFLKPVESNYNSAVEKLRVGEIDDVCIYTIAGFVAYVITCSPAGMRVHSNWLRSSVEITAHKLEANGLISAPPPELGGASLSELLRSGIAKIGIDLKYPQAIGISSILQHVEVFGNSKWEILRNDFADSPFFTSDFPAAIEESTNPAVLNRIVPLAPDLAIRIVPDPTVKPSPAGLSFANFGFRIRDISHKEIVHLNRLIVRCAEETVLYRDDMQWIRDFVARNRQFRIEPLTTKVPMPNGTLLAATLRVRAVRN